jgi:hypothetical protein
MAWDPPRESEKMAISVDDALNLSVMIMHGDRGWLVSMTTQGDARGSNVVDYEFADMRWDKSLVETEILVTAWLAGRGFMIQTPWHTTELTGSESGAFQTEAVFSRQLP